MMKTGLIIFALLGILAGCQQDNPKNEVAAEVSEEQDGIKLLSPQEFANGIRDNPSAMLLDVRTPEEYDAGHLATAQNVNIHDAEFMDQLMKLNKKQPVYVYCAVGGRSAKAANLLKKAGFEEIYDLKGGVQAWQKAGYTLEQ